MRFKARQLVFELCVSRSMELEKRFTSLISETLHRSH